MRRLELLGQFRQAADVGGSGPATPTDHLDAQILNEVHQLHLQFSRRQAVMGHASDVFGQACVGNATDGERRMLGQITDVLLHLLRTGRAVQSEDVNREGFKDRHHGCDV